MTAHGLHPDVHQHGLVEGCQRCEDLALHPDQLDDDMRDRLCYGRLVTRLDEIAARTLRESIPHPYTSGLLTPSLCWICGRAYNETIHRSQA